MPLRPSHLLAITNFTGILTFLKDTRQKGIITGLSLFTDKGEILKALLEGSCFFIKLNFEYLKEKNKLKINEINVVGGGSRSDKWLQMKADILNININSLSEENTGTVAAAIFAGMAIGAFKDFEEGQKIMLNIKKSYFPNKKHIDYYFEKFELYKDFLNKNIEINNKLYELNKSVNCASNLPPFPFLA